MTEEQLQKARDALSRISYDAVKIQKDCESLPDVAIMCGKNFKMNFKQIYDKVKNQINSKDVAGFVIKKNPSDNQRFNILAVNRKGEHLVTLFDSLELEAACSITSTLNQGNFESQK